MVVFEAETVVSCIVKNKLISLSLALEDDTRGYVSVILSILLPTRSELLNYRRNTGALCPFDRGAKGLARRMNPSHHMSQVLQAGIDEVQEHQGVSKDNFLGLAGEYVLHLTCDRDCTLIALYGDCI